MWVCLAVDPGGIRSLSSGDPGLSLDASDPGPRSRRGGGPSAPGLPPAPLKTSLCLIL